FTPVETPPSKQVLIIPDTTAAKTSVTPTVATAIPADKSYVVQKGDTLYNISKRFNLNVDDLKLLNNLQDNAIKIGQKLILVK
ncbi:MAG: LysM peptidoglycan-binding domain-containing protein, partial [Pedobacter sp.]